MCTRPRKPASTLVSGTSSLLLFLALSMQPVLAATQVWTDDPDWEQGQEVNVNHTAVPGQIQLNKGEGGGQIYTPFIWIANSGSNTVAKIDTRTGEHYPGSPFPVCTDPSRTAVDSQGNVWVNCRGDGRVMKLDAETGKPLLDLRPGGGVMRGIAIDRAGYVWAGAHDIDKIYKLDPDTGQVLATVDVTCPYGAAADNRGYIYVVSHYCGNKPGSESVHKISTETNQVIASYKFPACCPYGIAVDLDGDVWIGDSGGRAAVEIDPDTMTEKRRIGVVGIGRGIAVDKNNNMWVALSNNSGDTNEVAKVDQNTGRVTRIPVGVGPVGVAVDDKNNVWAVNMGSASVTKINADTNAVVGTYPTKGASPYTYSDMTGFAYQSISKDAGGTWTVEKCFPCAVTFGEIDYTSQEPDGTEVWITVRTASDQDGLEDAQESDPLHSGDSVPADGPQECIRITVHLRTDDANTKTPSVQDVTLNYEETGRPEECNGKDDDCDGAVDEELSRVCENECGMGTERCEDGKWVDCTAPNAEPEVCDYVDNDCDGQVDEDVTNACGGCGPVPDETCDLVDNDCDGRVDEGELCPEGCRCMHGECACGCQMGECPQGYVCENDLCVPKTCNSDSDCLDGKVCRNGRCAGPCVGVTCGPNEECRNGECVEITCMEEGHECPDAMVCDGKRCIQDPCAGVSCPAGQICNDKGNCIGSCANVICRPGESCMDGVCVADPCYDKECPEGQTCQAGTCVGDPCSTKTCPEGQVCKNGNCVGDPCNLIHCPAGQVCMEGQCTTGDADGDGVPDFRDGDDDDDGVIDSEDDKPLDHDDDGKVDDIDEDDDNDGIPDDQDKCADGSDCSRDTDNDGIPNKADEDDDGDGIPDAQDKYPLDPKNQGDAASDSGCGCAGANTTGTGPLHYLALLAGLAAWSRKRKAVP